MDEPAAPRPISPSRLSKTPSWITLGFVIGAVTVYMLPRESKPAASAPPAGPTTIVRLERPKITEIEAVFQEWGEYAVWEHDLTEVALWDTERRSYSICYEVTRRNDALYFRSIPQLTRPILTRGVDPQSPLQLTETERSRREWIEHGQYEPRSQPARAKRDGEASEP
jgi:hypothetical protein